MTETNRFHRHQTEAILAQTLDEWMKSGRYLPPFMRDFHDQKDVFKMVDEVRQNSVEGGNDYLKDLNWVQCQIYTVDIFLWVMAKNGYTLQRARKKPFAFRDIHETVSAAKERYAANAVRLMQSVFNKS